MTPVTANDAPRRAAPEVLPFARPAGELALEWSVDPQQGLTSTAAREHQRQYGLNQLTEAPQIPLWIRLAGQFKDLVVWILIVAAVISGAMGEWVDALAILAIVVL